MILCGDFNSEPGSKQIATLMATGLRDAYADLHNGNHTTTSSDGKTIDFIFYKEIIALTTIVWTNVTASDHKPVTAEFLL